ncbi:MAG: arylesterase [Saprospiraceae bacterium]
MKHLLVLAAFVSALFACQSATENQPQATNPTAQTTTAAPLSSTDKKHIVFFGNSLTAAFGLSPEQGFPALIQQKIDAAGLPYTCVNAGLSGETTAGGSKRVDWVLRQPVDVFVLELGGNDALRGLPIEESKKNLQAIIDQVKAKYPACKIVLAGMLAPPNMGEKYTRDFAAMYPAVAKANGLPLIPFLLEGVGGDAKLNQADGIHPTAEGQKIVAENVWKVLQPLL